MSSIMPKSERIEYSYSAHLESYNKILETWLLNKAPVKLQGAMRFYAPVSRKNKRFYVVENKAFHKINDDELKIPQDFGGLDWSEHAYAQANILHDAYLINGCVVYKDFIFSECISQNVNENTKINPQKIINTGISLPILYRYYSYDVLSNTASINWDKKNFEIIDKPCFLFNSLTGSRNFGHLVHDTLVQVSIYDYAKKIYPDIMPVIISESNIRGFKYQMMEWLFTNLVSDKYINISSNNTVLIKKLILPKKITDVFGSGINKLDIAYAHYFKNKIYKLINNTITTEHARHGVYVSRKDGNNSRAFSNQDKLEQLMQQKKISEIVVSKLSPAEIIAAFNSANMIIGAHGAGLMNYIFARQPVSLLEIESQPGKCANSIRQFGQLYGVDCLRVPVHKTEHSDLPRVDLDMLSHLIDQQISV